MCCAPMRFALPSVQIERAVPRGTGVFERVAETLVFRHERKVYPAHRLAALANE